MTSQARSRAISKKVKEKVYIRDKGRCVICDAPGAPNAHYISRAQGGLGIEENIVTLCARCHREYDQTIHREAYRCMIKSYLDHHYDMPDSKRIQKNRWEP